MLSRGCVNGPSSRMSWFTHSTHARSTSAHGKAHTATGLSRDSHHKLESLTVTRGHPPGLAITPRPNRGSWAEKFQRRNKPSPGILQPPCFSTPESRPSEKSWYESTVQLPSTHSLPVKACPRALAVSNNYTVPRATRSDYAVFPK